MESVLERGFLDVESKNMKKFEDLLLSIGNERYVKEAVTSDVDEAIYLI